MRRSIGEYHVVSGSVTTTDLEAFPMYPVNVLTLEGGTIKVTVDPIKLNKGIMIAPFFNNAGVAIPDVFATNGVVHVIDRVLLFDGGRRSLLSP